MTKRDAERKIREILKELEMEIGDQVVGVRIIQIEHGGLLGPHVDHALDVNIETLRLPGTRWMED